MTKHATPRVALFREWYANAKRGDRFIYHKGLLAQDRGDVETGRPVAPYHALAKLAYEAYVFGQVTLVQQRRGKFNFDYIAIRS